MTLQIDERMVHVVTGTGENARIRDLRLADVWSGESLAELGDDAVLRSEFLRSCELWLELEDGSLSGRVIDVTDEGHVIVSAPKVYG